MPPCGVWKTTGVPPAKLAGVVAGFGLDSPTSIDKIENPDGTFDVVATFPPCPDGSDSNQPDD
jgi:hypothetical protein